MKKYFKKIFDTLTWKSIEKSKETRHLSRSKKLFLRHHGISDELLCASLIYHFVTQDPLPFFILGGEKICVEIPMYSYFVGRGLLRAIKNYLHSKS
jgi:hypothetical protein